MHAAVVLAYNGDGAGVVVMEKKNILNGRVIFEEGEPGILR